MDNFTIKIVTAIVSAAILLGIIAVKVNDNTASLIKAGYTQEVKATNYQVVWVKVAEQK